MTTNFRPYSTTIKPDGVYFCTDVIVDHTPVFSALPYINIIIHGLRYAQSVKGLKLYAYVVMPTHVHTMISSPIGHLPFIWRDYKRQTSREIVQLAVHADESIFLSAFRKAAQVEQRGNEYKIWESGYHPQLMDDHDKLLQKIEYIHLNPVRKGLVEKPEDWKYSSARNYLLNDESIIKIDGLF